MTDMMKSSEAEPSRRERHEHWAADGLEWLGRCPVCQCTERRQLYRDLRDRVFFCAPGEWTLHACRGCGVAYLDPRPTAATIGLAYASYFTHHVVERPSSDAMGIARRWRRALANGYRNWRYGTEEQPASRLGIGVAYLLPRARAPLDLEFRHLPRGWPGARVLDVGAGDGSFLRWAAAAGWAAVGVDPDPAAVTAARSRGLNVYRGTLQDLHEESSFDVITANHVIEHVHDPRGFLERARHLLKPGGRLWLETPNLSSLGHQTFGPAWLGLDPPRHLVLFTGRTLRDLLRATGFRIVRQLPRSEVCQTTFAASQRIANGSSDPLVDGPAPLRLRLRAYVAGWRGRITPGRAEFLTIMAVRKA